jgi:hypothetical protein
MLKYIWYRLNGKSIVYSTSDSIRGSYSAGRKDRPGVWFKER